MFSLGLIGHGAYADPYFASVVSLLPLDADILDIKTPVWTAVGSAAISAVQSKFGGGSLVINAANTRLTTPNFAGFNFAAEDFTVEAWIYPLDTAGGAIVVGQANQSSVAGSSWVMGCGTTSSACAVYVGATPYVIDAAQPTINGWHHLAFVRQSGTLTSYLDGVRVDTRSDLGVSSVNVGTATYPPAIGSLTLGGAQQFHGYIDDVRVTKGVARYTGATYTVPTAAHPLS